MKKKKKILQRPNISDWYIDFSSWINSLRLNLFEWQKDLIKYKQEFQKIIPSRQMKYLLNFLFHFKFFFLITFNQWNVTYFDLKPAVPYLITLFPVLDAFSASILKPGFDKSSDISLNDFFFGYNINTPGTV